MDISFRKPVFWFGVMVLLSLAFGSMDGYYGRSFLFVAFLMPAMNGTSYLINSFLIPRYLFKQRYFKFGLYLFYTLVVSLYLEMVAVILGFALLANYQYNNLASYTRNIFFLTTTLYLIVLIESFVVLYRHFQSHKTALQELEARESRNVISSLVVKSNRETVSIPLSKIHYMESLSDYVKINCTDDEIVCKEQISRLPERLTDDFIRIHRSFIVNKTFVKSFNAQNIKIGSTELPVGRKFKDEALKKLER